MHLDDLRCLVNTLAVNTEFTDAMRESLKKHRVQPGSLARAILRRVLDLAPLYESLVSSLSLETLSEHATVFRLRNLQNLFTSFRLAYALDRLNAKPILLYETRVGYFDAYFGIVGKSKLRHVHQLEDMGSTIWSDTVHHVCDLWWKDQLGTSVAKPSAAERQALEIDKNHFLSSLSFWRQCVTALLDHKLSLTYLAPLVAALPIKPFLIEAHFALIPQGVISTQDPDEVFNPTFTPYMEASPALDSIIDMSRY